MKFNPTFAFTATLLVILMFSITAVSAWTDSSFTLDSSKQLEKEDAVTNWGKYEITESKWWDILKIWTDEKVKDIELIENTPECSNDCLAIVDIELIKDGTLVEEVLFKRDFGKGWVDWNQFNNWRIYVEQDVEQFETICKDGKEIIDAKNGTSYFEQDCSQNSLGYVKQWNTLDLGKTYSAGSYKVKLEGGKKEDTHLDWIFKTSGVLLSEWATWGRVNASLGDGLVAQYRLNTYGNQTDVRDTLETNNGVLVGKTFNNGNVSGGVTIDDGAMVFDGVNGYVNINSIEPLNITTNEDSFTFSSWVNVNNFPSQSAYARNILSARYASLRGSALFIRNDSGVSKFYFQTRNDTDSTRSITSNINSLNQWIFVTATYNQVTNNMSLYIDGNFISSTTGAKYSNQTTEIRIGGNTAVSGTLEYFNGSIDQVTIFNRSLSSSEIAGLYAQGRTQYSNITTGLVAQYSGRDFAGTEATPTTIYDTNHLTEGKVNQAFNFDGVDDYVQIIDTVLINSSNNYTASVWFYKQDTTDKAIFQRNFLGARLSLATTALTINYFNSSGSYKSYEAFTIPNISNSWNHMSYTAYNNGSLTTVKVYLNGINVANSTGNVGTGFQHGNFRIGYEFISGDRYWNGSIDDVRIYNRSLSETEILNIYNEGLGTEGVASAWVELQSPANGATAYTANNSFVANAEVEGGAYLVNMSFCSNLTGSWECGDTNNSLVTKATVGNAYTTSYGTSGTDTNSRGINFVMKANATQIVFTKISTSNPTKAFLYTSGGAYLANGTFSGDNVTINYNVVNGSSYTIMLDNGGSSYTNRYQNIGASTLTSVNVVGGIYMNSIGDGSSKSLLSDTNSHMVTHIYTINNLTINSSTQTWSKTIPAGSTLWNVQACDSDGDCGFSVANYTVSLDATAPTIEINSGNGTQNYGSLLVNHTLNFTITDDNIDECWYEYNGTNSSDLGCSTGVLESINFTLVKDLYTATIYANDTAGNLETQLVTWDYNFFATGESYNPTSTTTTVETFGINITTATAQIPVAYLVYNGTETLATRTGTTTNHVFSVERTMISAGTFNFYWRITYGTSELNTTTNSQVVSAVTAGVIINGSCPAGLTQVMNFTFADETNLSALGNMTVKYNFKYGITNSTGATSAGILNLVSQASLCLNLTQSSTYQIGYGEIDYEKTDYSARRFYVFENTRASNQTINTTLYSLPTTSSTSFLLEIRSPTLSPYVGYYTTLLRWYPSANEYKVVEMGKTDDKGQTVKKVKIEDVDYRIGIYETNGTLIYLANPIRMVCLATPCSYTLNVPTDATDSFEEVDNIEVDLSYTAGVFTLVYNDPSQNTEIMSLRVYKMGGSTDRLICEANGTSFTGILNCDVSSESGTLRAIAIRTASPERPLALLIIDTLTTVFTGTFGLFIQFLIIVTLAFLGIVSPVVAIIMAIIALLMGVLVFKTFSYALLIGVALLGGIVIHLMKRSAGQ